MSTNIFAEIGLSNPEERLVKAELVLIIRQLVNDAHLTQMQVAEKAGMSQPGVSRMLRGMAKDISVDRLLQVVVSLGHSVRISVDADITTNSHLEVTMAVPDAKQRELAVV
jgi:predicted XRE-type DNA-binding protein